MNKLSNILTVFVLVVVSNTVLAVDSMTKKDEEIQSTFKEYVENAKVHMADKGYIVKDVIRTGRYTFKLHVERVYKEEPTKYVPYKYSSVRFNKEECLTQWAK